MWSRKDVRDWVLGVVLMAEFRLCQTVSNRAVDSLQLDLPSLPCHVCCWQAKETRGAVDAEEEVAAGLTAYFDKCLLPLLLYRNERTQAAEVSGS
jgi:hypothetical protein